MADYDAKIRVSTDIDSSDIKRAEKEVERLAKKLDGVRQRSAKLEALGGTEKQFESLGYDAEILEGQLADATESLEQLRTKGFDKAEKSAKKCFDTVNKGAKKSSNSFGSILKVLRNIVLSMIAFQVIAKGAEYIAEGFNNLVQYSSELNGVFSGLKSELATLKNSMATAFAPIVAQIIPYLTMLLSWLNNVMNIIAQFWAYLGGKNMYTRAKKQVVDYAKSVNSATKSVKKSLAAFDELNVLSKNESANSGEVSGALAFEEVGIDESKFTWVEKLKQAFDKVVEAAKPLISTVKDGLVWLLKNVLVPIGGWAIDTVLPAVMGLIASAFSTLKGIIDKIQPALEWLLNNFFLPVGEWLGVLVVGVIDEMTLAFDELLDNVSDIIDGLQKVLGGVVNFIAGVFTGNWKRAWNGLAQIVEGVWGTIKGIINIILSGIEALVNGVIKAVNKLIDALNISISVPSWAQDAVGTDKITITNLPHINRVQLPRLATGGIVTSSTLANIGEAGREAVLPLENNTEWMDALADRINSRGGEIRVVAELDGKVVYDNVVKRDREFAGRTGHSQFAY